MNSSCILKTFARVRSSADTSAAWHRPRGSQRYNEFTSSVGRHGAFGVGFTWLLARLQIATELVQPAALLDFRLV